MNNRLSYNPDVLSCLANLSNDEVFTPPQLANQMLDMLPQELFRSPDTKFLDPCTKSGVFLREIAKRLIEGLAETIPDLQQRIDHIMHHQLYGIAITRLTSMMSRRSLYCSKSASGKYSISQFDDEDGNIRYRDIKHSWVQGKCKYCGASQEVYDRGDDLESHAYEFIHTDNPNTLYKNMTFDVIIGNPPYQLTTGGTQSQATPLYHHFVKMAKKTNPKYLVMITPSRWFAGGMGLDSFREEMLNDDRLKVIVDYPNAKDCFPNISIGGGVNYFLWARDYHGKCLYSNIHNSKVSTEERILNEFPVFVRYNMAINIIHKILKLKEKNLSEIISSLSPFGLGSAERGHSHYQTGDIVLYSSKGKSYISKREIISGKEYLDYYHVMMSKVTSEHANEPTRDGTFKVISRVQPIRPNEACTFSYFLIGNFKTEDESNNILSYLFTRFARFLLLQSISSINISKDKFQFVPLQDFSKPWTDEELYAKYGLTEEEIQFIESMIRPME